MHRTHRRRAHAAELRRSIAAWQAMLALPSLVRPGQPIGDIHGLRSKLRRARAELRRLEQDRHGLRRAAGCWSVLPVLALALVAA